ncbi:phospholipid phosphatase 3 isoform X2 [Tribolium castaneum]|uniref:phospholipid phosphatase 3 isoform X2 n=1 Tax=Tribolium castaneum TaxID=7070 RepID=UPI00077DE040|nr:PREDICTED: phospholipid phosphatase 3 isoform X2 [Tribolium castaneum]|eukprot:XP_015836547.1 PREDICTED: phospholipid phosphatase 3 isoform X2 [Tribolium castaneum]
MDSPPTLSLTQICTDSLILAIVGFPILLIRKSGKIHERGFFCNDVTITHPIPEVSTINNKYFHLVGNLLTIFIIISVELSIIKRQEKVKLWRLWCYNIYQILTCFTLGLLATILITTIFKGSIGRLRPYFFNSCLPNVNCSLPQNHHVYHTIFTCTNKNYKKNSRTFKLRNVLRTFPRHLFTQKGQKIQTGYKSASDCLIRACFLHRVYQNF